LSGAHKVLWIYSVRGAGKVHLGRSISTQGWPVVFNQSWTWTPPTRVAGQFSVFRTLHYMWTEAKGYSSSYQWESSSSELPASQSIYTTTWLSLFEWTQTRTCCCWPITATILASSITAWFPS